MDEHLRNLERRARSGDPEARQLYVANLLRSGNFEQFQNLLLDQISHDVLNLNDCLYQYKTSVHQPLYISPSNTRLTMLRGEPPPPTLNRVFNFVSGRNCYISAIADWGVVPHSELAMHARIAGKTVKRYCVCALGPEPANYAMSAAVFVEDAQEGSDFWIGTTGEVLPDEVRRNLGGFGRELVPSSLNYFMHGEFEITSRADLNLRICHLHLFYYPLLGAVYFRINYNYVGELTTIQLAAACEFIAKCVLHVIPEVIAS